MTYMIIYLNQIMYSKYENCNKIEIGNLYFMIDDCKNSFYGICLGPDKRFDNFIKHFFLINGEIKQYIPSGLINLNLFHKKSNMNIEDLKIGNLYDFRTYNNFCFHEEWETYGIYIGKKEEKLEQYSFFFPSTGKIVAYIRIIIEKNILDAY